MAADTDYLLTGNPDVATIGGNSVEPLIDGFNFFPELGAALNLANGPGDFIYLHGWCLGLVGGNYEPSGSAAIDPAGASGFTVNVDPLTLIVDGTIQAVTDILKQKARGGVDVRVLGWISPLGMGSQFAEANWFHRVAGVSSLTCASILELRKEPTIGANAALNAIGHAAGAVHTKLWVIGNSETSIAFTGGMDMLKDRFSDEAHSDKDNLWHDAAVKIEGPAVQTIHDVFRRMWNLNALRKPYKIFFAGQEPDPDKGFPNVLDGTAQIAPRTVVAPVSGTDTLQSLVTIPAANYSSLSCFQVPPAVPDAPNGSFQVQLAWQKAISMADTYIYMEDQSFWSRDVMGWINQRLQVAPNLKVILLFPGRADPDDPKFPLNMYLTESINHALLNGLGDDARARIRAFRRWGPQQTQSVELHVLSLSGGTARVEVQVTVKRDTPQNAYARRTVKTSDGTLYPVVSSDATAQGNRPVLTLQLPAGVTTFPQDSIVDLIEILGIVVHSKTTLIDDKWAIIGSSNCTRRSLFTDWEHSVAFIEGTAGTVSGYRRDLWNEHFQHDNPDDFTDIQSSLHSWEPTWGTAGGAAPPLPQRDIEGPSFLDPLPLPLAENPIDSDTQEIYDTYDDNDSRSTWGSICDIARAVSTKR